MDSLSITPKPSNEALLARPDPGRFRIGGKLVDKATQKRIEELIAESTRFKKKADDAIKECEDAKGCLTEIKAELEKKMER